MKTKNLFVSLVVVAVIAGFTACTFADEEKEEAISMNKVPQVVKDTLAKYASESEVKKVEKGDQDGKKVFEFDIEKSGRKFEVAISRKGKFMGTEEDMALKDMPEAVQKTLTEKAAGGTISGGEKAIDANDKVTYEADITTDGKKSEIAVDADGKVVNTDAVSKEKDEKSEGKEKD